MTAYSRIIFDLDGVVYRGHTPIPGAAEAIARIRQSGMPIAFITNNATRSRRQLQKRLAAMGIRVRREELMTSAYAAACYLGEMKPRPRSVCVIGERGLRDELRAAGLRVQDGVRGAEAATSFSHLSAAERKPGVEVLVSGLDRRFDYAKMVAGLDALNAGARWVACNLDPTLPMENGMHPGSGALAASLAYAAGAIRTEGRGRVGRREGARMSNIIPREPDRVVGKPQTYMLDRLCGPGDRRARRTMLFVGDRLDMDIAFAHAAGLRSLLVLSGVTTRAEAARARGALKPDAILPSIARLPEWLGL